MRKRKKRIKELLTSTESVRTYNPVIIHFIPAVPIRQFELSPEEDKEIFRKNFNPLYSYTSSRIEYNFYGLRIYSNMYENETRNPYVQIFRNGTIEYFSTSLIEEESGKILRGKIFNDLIHQAVQEVVNYIKLSHLTYPINMYLSILNSTGLKIVPERQYVLRPEIMNNDLLFPGITFENEDSILYELNKFLNVVWQSGGFDKNPYPIKEGTH
jgi:hypothetical protein